MQVQNKNKRPLKTMGDSRLYAQGINPVLVKLEQYEATRLQAPRLQPPYSQMVFAWLQEGNKVHDIVNLIEHSETEGLIIHSHRRVEMLFNERLVHFW